LNYIWKFRQKPDESAVQELVNSNNIPKSLARVLLARGISESANVRNFFEPSLDLLHDPFLMNGMDVAVDRIISAINKEEQIWIHGDYDVDGTASASMLLEFLREIGGKVGYYIPDRFIDGYGIPRISINKAKQLNTKLLITVDLGVTSYEALEYAAKRGIETIICDHHEPGETLPPALAILDPLKPNCKYPFKNLAACGVTFKLIQAISKKLNIPDVAFSYLDYVAIASAADMVPLINENRILSYFGLKQLNEKPRPGIKGLLECTNLKVGNITALNIIYSLAPLINAAGRLGDASRAVEMMTQKNELTAFRIAQELEQENRRRRIFDEKTFEEAIPMADKLLQDPNRRSIVIHSPNWHAGVIGIVASRLVDKYHLPSIILTTMDGLAKGSARSISKFDVYKALKKCSSLLIEFGGHKHAAGITLEEKSVPILREQFDEIARSLITDDMIENEQFIDTELDLNELSPNFIQVLRKFAPFGYDNFKPIFLSRGVVSANGIKVVGNNHIKFRALQSNFAIDAIGYNLLHKSHFCADRKPFTIIYHLEETNFFGHPTIQLRIKDIAKEDFSVD